MPFPNGVTGDFAMLEGILTIIRLLVPFLYEVVFGNASTKAWFKKNGLTLLWLLFIILMLGVVLRVAGVLSRTNHDNIALTAQNTTLTHRVQQLELQCPKPHSPTVTSSRYTRDPHARATQDLLDELRQIKTNEEH